jgi:hypothetical protein
MDSLKSLISTFQVGTILTPVDDSESEIRDQFKQFTSLINRAANADLRKKYLNHYDAMLRLIEIVLLEHGYRLGEQPHATARKIVHHLYPAIDFRGLANARHSAKKQNVVPSPDSLQVLLELQGYLFRETEHLHQAE